MDAARWTTIERVVQLALDAPGFDRAAILQRSCGDDGALRREVESLLDYHARADDFLETPASLPVPHRVGTTIGHYRVVEEIGGGGMGVVYKAEDTRLGRVVALKFLAGRHSSAPEALERFRGEARAASALNHPNVCVIYDIGEADGEQFIAMEFIEGRTLADLMSGPPLEIEHLAAIGRQIADALAAAHGRGIVHLDIKPANIIVAPGGLVKVLDFGVARLLRRDVRGFAPGAAVDAFPIAGTLPYMSPEQLRGDPVDARADLFSLGVVLYELATGQRPFQGGTIADLGNRNHRAPVAPRHVNRRVPARLDGILRKCLAKDPDDRYPGAAVLATELRQLSTGATTLGRRGPWLMAALAALGAVTAITWSSARRGDPAGQASWEQLTDFPDSATSPALSSDGRLLTFIRGASTFVGPGDVYLKAFPDGEARQLTNDLQQKQDPLFTPDGSRITYTTGPLPYDVWSIPIAGGTPQPLMRNASTLSWLGGGRVMFGEVRGAPHMAIVTSDERRGNVREVYVPSRVSGMAHRAYRSPDQKWVLIAEMDTATAGQGWLPCRLMPFDASSIGTPVGPPKAPCTSAAWSPDGTWMYLSAAVDGSYHIWRQRFPRGEPEQVTAGPTQEEGLAMAADGRSIVTSVGSAQSTLWLRDASGERRVDSEATAQWPRFSRDGRTLFYIAQKSLRALDRESGELWAVDVASGTRRRVLPDFRVAEYDIASDGARVAAVVIDGDGRSHLWLAPVDGHESPRRFEWPTPIVTALFDRAGGLFLRAREDAGDFVYHVDPSGALRRRVIADPVAAILAVSPSNQWLLARARLPGREASSLGVVAYPLDGGSPVPMFESLWPAVQWAGDGKALEVRFVGEDGRTVAIASVPVSPDAELPAWPAGGLKQPRQAAGLPGATVIPLPVTMSRDIASIATSSDLATLAILRTAVHRNLYRVPLP